MDLDHPASMSPWLHAPVAGGDMHTDDDLLTVGAVAELVGISVRTLHHWDAQGIVRPRARTAGGYRAYDADDVARIHRVLVYRELGLGLARIAAILDGDADETQQLRDQRDEVTARIARLETIAGALDHMLEARTAGTTPTPRQQAQFFGTQWREGWGEQAREQWGQSAQWEQFEQRVSRMSAQERQRAHDEGDAVYERLSAALRAGVLPGSELANLLAEEHRRMIGIAFDCTHGMHVCLGRHYRQDAGFRDYFEQRQAGLADWLSAVIDENARRHGVDPARAEWR